MRSDPVHGNGRCALRAPSLVRQRRRSARRRRARALRGRGPLGARRPVTALGAYGEDVRAPESQARLLPLHGVPDRALAGQQHHEPAARSRGAARGRGQRPRLAGRARAGARRRSGQRRPGPPGGVLPRFHGHDAVARHGLRAPVRIRHLQAGHRRRLAARAAGQLAAPAGPVGSRPPVREGGDQDELRRRGARRDVAPGHRPNLEPDRAALRSPGGGLRRQDDQHAPPLGGCGARVLRLPGVQPR